VYLNMNSVSGYMFTQDKTQLTGIL
jgi:hypothetical protein